MHWTGAAGVGPGQAGWLDAVMTNSVGLRGTSWDSQNVCAWRVSTSQLTLAVRRRCGGRNAQPRQTWGVSPMVEAPLAYPHVDADRPVANGRALALTHRQLR